MVQRIHSSVRAGVACLAVALSLALCMLFVPVRALAREYEISSVEIEANVETDGSLVVREVREFDFDGSFHGVYWQIPTGRYEGRDIETTILSVGEIIDGQFIEFERSDSGAEHTYELSSHSSYVEVKLYSSHSDERAYFGISYRDSNLATRYLDCGELYWKFVSDGWDVESENVTCTVSLPVPDDTVVVPGETVRAWGHGPLDASVSFTNNGVLYEVPGVGSSEYAEARVVFPAEWLSDAAPSSDVAHLQGVLDEEQAWADEANAKRTRARVMLYGTYVLGLGIPLLSVLYGLMRWGQYKTSHKAQFDDKYFRDVPSDDHPAILGALLNNGNPTDECLTASLMRLTDSGYAKLELKKSTKKGLFGREKAVEDYCMSALYWPERRHDETGAERIDFETMRLMFDRLLRLEARVTDDADNLYFGSLEKTAKKYPESYDKYYKSWQGVVEAECERRMFFKDDTKTGRGLLIAIGVIDLIVMFGALFASLIFGAPVLMIVALLVLGLLASGATILMGSLMRPLSREAIETVAKLKALRNWLLDFTRLEEAVPQDVILWNRLLVMAVVLGVSEEVIKQLRMVAPQLLEDTRMAPTYIWYSTFNGHQSPTRTFTEAASTAHSVSVAQLASSSSSSGGGGGGGFSGGGGGGFGGGGGGGAF